MLITAKLTFSNVFKSRSDMNQRPSFGATWDASALDFDDEDVELIHRSPAFDRFPDRMSARAAIPPVLQAHEDSLAAYEQMEKAIRIGTMRNLHLDRILCQMDEVTMLLEWYGYEATERPVNLLSLRRVQFDSDEFLNRVISE